MKSKIRTIRIVSVIVGARLLFAAFSGWAQTSPTPQTPNAIVSTNAQGQVSVTFPGGLPMLITSMTAFPTNSPPAVQAAGSFLGTAAGYFTTLNPDLAGTFATAGTNAERGEFWIGAALQNNRNIGNQVGASYNVGKNFSIESCTLNDGVLNTIDTQELGLGYSLVVVDTKLTASLLGGYRISPDQAYGAIALSVKKAVTTHTFLGLRIEVQSGGKTDYVPIVTAMTGFTF